MGKYIISMFVSFFAGVVVTINLFILIPTNHASYDAQWWKVGLAFFVFFGFTIWGALTQKH